MKAKNFLFIIFSLFLLVLTSWFAFAAPPFVGEFESGFTLEITAQDYHKLGEPYYVHTHVYNTTTGVLLNDGSVVSCYYHAYDCADNCVHVEVGNLTQYGAGFFAWINESNFDSLNKYYVLVWCNSSVQGGFAQNSFVVTRDGLGGDFSFGWLAIVGLLLGYLFVLGFSSYLLKGVSSRDEVLFGVKNFLFLLFVVNGFLVSFLSVLVAFYPYSPVSSSEVFLGLLSVNALALVFFVWSYGFRMLKNVLKLFFGGKKDE